ncbi:Chromosome-partitioning protein Spo0J [compost metagenome]
MAANARTAQGVISQKALNYLDVGAIRRKPGFNPRFEFGDIELLARSIAANGVLNSLRVRKVDVGVFELVDGDRRLTAIELLVANSKAGKSPSFTFPHGVPCIIVDAAQDAVTDIVQMFEANTGKAFLPLEKAAAFRTMRDAGLTIADIEARTGCSDNDIVGSLALLEGDETLVEATRTGKVKGGLAKSIAVNARGDKKLQRELTEKAIAAGTDKVAKRAVLKEVDNARRAKAAKKGLTLKMRALSDDELGALGVTAAEALKLLLDELGMDYDSDLRSWIAADPELRVAATFGALEGLKAAAGVKTSLEF